MTFVKYAYEKWKWKRLMTQLDAEQIIIYTPNGVFVLKKKKKETGTSGACRNRHRHKYNHKYLYFPVRFAKMVIKTTISSKFMHCIELNFLILNIFVMFLGRGFRRQGHERSVCQDHSGIALLRRGRTKNKHKVNRIMLIDQLFETIWSSQES